MTRADWPSALGVILDGAFSPCEPRWRTCGRAARVPSSSGSTGARERAHVITAKAGLVGLTRALAHELAGRRHYRQLRGPGPDRYGARSQSAVAAAPPGAPHSPRPPRQRRGDRRRRLLSVRPPARDSTGLHVNGGVYLG